MVEIRELVAVDQAIFAKVDIARGTRISAEIPLIMLPPTTPFEEELSGVCKIVDSLTNEELKELDQLPCSSKMADEIRERGFVANQVWSFYKSKKLKNSDGTLLKGKKLRKIVNKMVNLCISYLLNNVQLGPSGKYGSGLFSLYSRIGHSCVPNAFSYWNPTLQRLTIHAIHDIKAGQQIFVNYTGTTCWTRNQRGFSLYAVWKIVCNCEACTDDAIDKLRYRMLLLDQALAAYQLGISHDPRRTGVPKLETAQQALCAAEELVKLLKRQRLCGMEICRA
ncbi:hypothetical protein F4811DRAFT_544547 [Daldinia bambusicola]|nr:hypothetical protein F4811DRAFT_544547 [Daldinia bambusicola]